MYGGVGGGAEQSPRLPDYSRPRQRNGGGFAAVAGDDDRSDHIIGRGVTDPHIRIFTDWPYLYASHDYSPDSTHFDMRDFWIS
jgi:hypothetical protein